MGMVHAGFGDTDGQERHNGVAVPAKRLVEGSEGLGGELRGFLLGMDAIEEEHELRADETRGHGLIGEDGLEPLGGGDEKLLAAG